jgi:endonuclease YncB( thermonuclease family)
VPVTFFTIGDGSPRAVVGIRRRNDATVQPPDEAVPDGDTVGIQLDGTGAVRFLGIDTPEKSFQQPLGGGAALDGPKWEEFLASPFGAGLPANGLEPALVAHLRARVGPGAAANHHRHAMAAAAALRALIESDVAALGQTRETFRYFLAFSYEVFDGNGRCLAFVNRNQLSPNIPGPRPDSYNERMLQGGHALPYFIWPNVEPFRDARSVASAVPAPGTASATAERGALEKAREFVRRARAAKQGVFDAVDPLRFEAFEIRYLGRGKAPDRAVIDLSRDDDVMLRPQSYFKIARPEDRLFVPPEFVPLFAARGWRLEDLA